ncbi:glycosyltransferase family 1 protein [Leptolyngbyaceae cyanobacterium CCMR0082]|uniref:Glycosyltransferase family 1 protein n=1 Tax=Adonisia turfae CCMR0082 TaxID=2304604 RepID=A0A6M0SGQ3_9CYAN|nr:glycosyltransferase family 1 protein [Adonisia turfae]NEZ67153.1 glycosyltransferase family 1 protein [Adonisia turfae CCMR0082]
MRITILRRSPGVSFSMDVYADAVVEGLRAVRPNWEIVENFPDNPVQGKRTNSLLKGIQKYHQRYWQYPKGLQNCESDIFHIIDHSDGYLVNWLKTAQVPVVVTCHDLINLVHPELFRDRALMPWLSLATWKYSLRSMCEAHRIVSVSDYTAQDIIKYLDVDATKIQTVPNGVDDIFQAITSQAEGHFRQDLNIPAETCCLLNVGSNNPRKNIITILKVVAQLQTKGFPIHFWKAGDDFTHDQKKFIAEHQLDGRISYLGKPDKETLIKIYNAADILVAPSTYEGFGITVLEAMACGLPVIASNVTSLPEVVDDAAILVEPLDINGIAKSVEAIFKDPDVKRELITKGTTRAAKFTWKNTAEQIAQIYESLLASAAETNIA